MAVMLTLLLFIMGSKGKIQKHIPFTTPFAVMTPHSEIVLQQSTATVMYAVDASIYFEQLLALSNIFLNLTQKANDLGANSTSWPQLHSVANHTYSFIENAATDLLNALEALPHSEECHLFVREKRDINVVSEQGIFPAVGRCMAWLTGTMTSDAAHYINLNYNNIEKITKSQRKMLKIVNHTSILTYENKVKIDRIKIKINKLEVEMRKETDREQLIDKLILTLQDLALSVAEVNTRIQEFISFFQYAAYHKIDQSLFIGPLWPQVVEALDPTTRNIHNLKHFVMKGSTIKIEGCITHVKISLAIPTVRPKKIMLYKVHRIPSYRVNHYQFLAHYPQYIAWNELNVLEYNDNEVNSCKQLEFYKICKQPKVIEKLKANCLYSLIKDLTPKCSYRSSQNESLFLSFDSEYLTYYVPQYVRKVANLKCETDDMSKTQILQAGGTIFVPPGCIIYIDHLSFESPIFEPHKILNYKPRFFKPDLHVLQRHPIVFTTVKPSLSTDEIDLQFEQDSEQLVFTSQILGEIKFEPDHFIYATMTMSVFLMILMILVIILFYLWFKDHCCKCRGSKTRTRPHRDSI